MEFSNDKLLLVLFLAAKGARCNGGVGGRSKKII